ncbi:hypothetical protein Nepgr_002259 [Nepenthes gracilis]|uniref:Uncharacterized protein n=1 Tax=Nepenthes gracilis TaxID=150966 RepID=A0AAD3P3L2_NEPGR|nr:hypothetical protein Nepgr_002259 [Nepenthes gracilis]
MEDKSAALFFQVFCGGERLVYLWHPKHGLVITIAPASSATLGFSLLKADGGSEVKTVPSAPLTISSSHLPSRWSVKVTVPSSHPSHNSTPYPACADNNLPKTPVNPQKHASESRVKSCPAELNHWVKITHAIVQPHPAPVAQQQATVGTIHARIDIFLNLGGHDRKVDVVRGNKSPNPNMAAKADLGMNCREKPRKRVTISLVSSKVDVVRGNKSPNPNMAAKADLGMNCREKPRKRVTVSLVSSKEFVEIVQLDVDKKRPHPRKLYRAIQCEVVDGCSILFEGCRLMW